MMKARLLINVLVLLFLTLASQAQTLLPRPDPPRAVNDYTGLLSSSEAQALEQKLSTFTDTTSNAIVIVIVNDLQGYDRSEFAYIIGKEWGVGQADFNNGVVVLIKPKTDEASGLAFIATGYGLEGAIPDIACASIIDREMIPHFRNNEYYQGLDAGTNVLMALAAGEYSYNDYVKKAGSGSGKAGGAAPAIIFLIIIGVIIMAASGGNKNNQHFGSKKSSNLPLWILLSMMSGGRSHGGSWGGFSGGGGGFGGGGGGGFGGFGGGGFGGGGAGGSW